MSTENRGTGGLVPVEQELHLGSDAEEICTLALHLVDAITEIVDKGEQMCDHVGLEVPPWSRAVAAYGVSPA